jgi:hypothetical protein
MKSPRFFHHHNHDSHTKNIFHPKIYYCFFSDEDGFVVVNRKISFMYGDIQVYDKEEVGSLLLVSDDDEEMRKKKEL